MKKKFIFQVVFVGSLFCHSLAMAYTVTGNAHALIRTGVTSSQVQQMNFGTIDANAAGGTVTLSPAGTPTATGGLALSATASQGQFTISADPSTNLTVSITPSTLTGSGSPMAINTFTTNPAMPTIPTGASGVVTLNVGADLVVGANQDEGAYSGTYSIIVNY